MSVRQLPHGVIKLISSTQVISSVSTVVKELVENSIDAGATVIDIKLEKAGLDKIEVRDNGCGINKADAYNVCLPNYTSKIHSFDDLEQLRSYGFRGEALNSLCAVAQLSITTKTETEEIASTFLYDNNGTVREVEPSHFMKGTIVTIKNLFKNVPVRRHFFESTRKATEELKKTEKIVKMLSVIHPKLKVTIAHNKCLIWHKTAVNNLRQSLMQVYPHVVLKNLVEFSSSHDDLSLEMLICKRDCNWSVLCQPLGEAILFFVNERPVKDKKVEKVVLEEMTHMFASSLPNNKCPLTLISLKTEPQNLDVNLEPDKSKIFMKNHEEVLKQIRESIMLHFYEQPVGGDSQKSAKNSGDDEVSKKRKVDDSPVDLIPTKKLQCENSIPPSVLCLDTHLNFNSAQNIKSYQEIRNDLLDLDASQFEETSMDNEVSLEEDENSAVSDSDNKPACNESFTLEPSSPNNNVRKLENEMKDDELFYSELSLIESSGNTKVLSLDHEKEPDVCDDVVERSADSQQTLSFNVPFECAVEKENLKSIPHESIEASLDVGRVDSDSDPFNESEFIRNECDINFSDMKKQVNGDCEKNDSVPVSEKILNQTTLSQWSKGLVNVDGQPLEGGVFIAKELNSRIKNMTNDAVPKSKKRTNFSEEPITPNAMERSVSSQMGRKDLAGLTNFARTIRTQIINENPGITFTKVASELANRWRNLNDEEKNAFSERATSSKNKKMAPSGTPTPLIQKTSVLVDMSIDHIGSRLNNFQNISSSRSKNIYLISPLRKESEWICKIGKTINAVCIPRLKENVLLHRYLCHMSLPLQPLEEPLQITQSIVGDELWEILLSLKRNCASDSEQSIISDSRIANNGFKIIINEEFPKKFSAVITEVTDEFRSVAVETLVETLKLIQNYDNLQFCRPAVVKQYMQTKVRKNLEDPFKETEVKELLSYWCQFMSQMPVSSFDAPVSVKLHNLS